MTNKEINLQNLNYDLNKDVQFRVELNELYNDFCLSIKRRKKYRVRTELYYVIRYIWENIEFIKCLSNEERYMVLNCVKLGKSIKNKVAIKIYNTEEYQELSDSYAKLR